MIKLSLSLRYTIPLLVVLPLVAATSTTGWLALMSGRKTVDSLSADLTAKVATQVADNLATYIRRPHQLNRLASDAISLGRLDPEAMDQIQRYFWQQLPAFPTLDSVYFGTVAGEFRSAGRLGADQLTLSVVSREQPGQVRRYLAGPTGEPTNLLTEQSGFDPRERPWYQAAAQADRAIWSDLYPDFDSQRLGITAARAVRDEQGQLLGVLGVDLFFAELEAFLQNLAIGKTGKAYITERDGTLIASSLRRQELMPTTQAGDRRFSIASSRDPLTVAMVETLVATFGDLSLVGGEHQIMFRAENQRQFLRVYPFTDPYGLDWLILIVIPEADFGAGLGLQLLVTALLGGAVLAIAAAGGLAVGRWLLRPITRLNQAAAAIEAQTFDPASIDDLAARDDEVGEFARVFLEMALAIDDRETRLGTQIRSLNFQEQMTTTVKEETLREQLMVLRDRARALQTADADPT